MRKRSLLGAVVVIALSAATAAVFGLLRPEGAVGADQLLTNVSNTGDASSKPTDLVITAPFMKRPKPRAVSFDAESRIDSVDLYTILDRSPSMATENSSLKNNLAAVLDGLQCPPTGTGDPADCIPNLWAGAGTVGYSGSGAAAFQNHVDVQPNPIFSAIPTTEPTSSNTTEPLTFSIHAAITGEGGANYGVPDVPSRFTCNGSPARSNGYDTFGYPCFRQGVLPVIVLATDEAPLSGPDTIQNPSWSPIVRDEMRARGARFVGLVGANADAATQSDLNQMATDTGSVDATNGNAPLVFTGSDANAATALGDGIRTLVDGLPLDPYAIALDNPSDAVDSVAVFVDHIEVEPRGSRSCAGGLATRDIDGDGLAETYTGAIPGTLLCWRLVAKVNTTVPPTSSEQIFHVRVSINAGAIIGMAEQDVFFVVPAA